MLHCINHQDILLPLTMSFELALKQATKTCQLWRVIELLRKHSPLIPSLTEMIGLYIVQHPAPRKLAYHHFLVPRRIGWILEHHKKVAASRWFHKSYCLDVGEEDGWANAYYLTRGEAWREQKRLEKACKLLINSLKTGAKVKYIERDILDSVKDKLKA